MNEIRYVLFFYRHVSNVANDHGEVIQSRLHCTHYQGSNGPRWLKIHQIYSYYLNIPNIPLLTSTYDLNVFPKCIFFGI